MALWLKGGNALGVWSPDLYEEMVAVDFRQEDLSDGEVASWLSGGIKPKTATQGTQANRPTKLADNGGVKFDKNSVQSLEWAVDTDAHLLNRGWLCISRCDIAGNSGQTDVPVVTINGASGSEVVRQPHILYTCTTATYKTHLVDGSGTLIQSGAANTAFADWNINIGFRRGWQLHTRINGVANAPLAHLGMRPNSLGSLCSMGAHHGLAQKADVAIDLFMIFQGEMSDAFVDRLEGWAHWRMGMEAQLP